MEGDERERAAREEQLKQEDRERIAPREQHEARLAAIVGELRAGGYFRAEEEVRISFPAPGSLRSPWRKKDGSWRPGMGRAIARIETTGLNNPPADPDRRARYPNGDHFEPSLVAAGYVVDVWQDDAGCTADTYKADYYIYERPNEKPLG